MGPGTLRRLARGPRQRRRVEGDGECSRPRRQLLDRDPYDLSAGHARPYPHPLRTGQGDGQAYAVAGGRRPLPPRQGAGIRQTRAFRPHQEADAQARDRLGDVYGGGGPGISPLASSPRADGESFGRLRWSGIS
jgi:hypothetical protein